MAANEILKFVETDTTTNLLTQAEYSADPQRDIGNQPGIARSKLVNKAMRQASLIAAGIAQYVADKQALDVTDELTPAEFALMMSDAFDAEFVKLTGATMSGALALFGGDTGVTPAQFDNDTSLATTAFVRRALGNFSGQVTLSAPANILASHAGLRIVSSLAGTLTLPALSSVPVGTKFYIVGLNLTTINRSGSDVISAFSSAGLTSVSIPLNSIGVITAGEPTWNFEEGSAALKYTAEFDASLAANGYQKLPSGLIIQWGAVLTNASGLATITYPIAFPSAAYSGNLTVASGGIYYDADFDALLGLSSVPIRLNVAISQLVYYVIYGK